MCLYVKQLVFFFIQFTDNGGVYISTSPIEELYEIQQEIDEYLSTINHPVGPSPRPKRNEMCLACHNGVWYRAMIQKCFVSVQQGTIAE